MKKTIILITLLALMSALVACAKTTSSAGTTGKTPPLSTEAELLVGTFKLENTDQAVSAEQAKQLLPLWQTLQSLSNSNTAATEEINAVVDQIKSTMTASQMAKITALKLTQQDVMSIMMQAGVSPNDASTTATPLALNGLPSGGGNEGGGAQGGPGGGGAPGGGPPAGGGFPGGSDTGLRGGPGGQSSTPQAVRPVGMGNQVPAPLLNALIELLQKKINS